MRRVVFCLGLACFLAPPLIGQPIWRQLVGGDVRTMSIAPNGWYAASADHLLKSTNRGEQWDTLEFPEPTIDDFTSVVFVPGSGTIVLSSEPGVYWSTDHGAGWTWGGAQAVGVYSLAVDSSGRLFASGSVGVLQSSDHGVTWDSAHSIPGPFTDGLVVTPNGRVLASSIVGGLLSTDDHGASWDTLRGLASPPGLVTALAVSQVTNTMLAAVVHIHNTGAGAPLYRSTDGGSTWSVVDSGFVLIDALASDSQGRFYAGGNSVRRSTDDGVTWQTCGEAYPADGHVSALVPIDSLLIACDRNHGILMLGQVSTSVEQESLHPTTIRLEHNYPNPFNSSTLIAYQVADARQPQSQAGPGGADAGLRIRLAVYDLLGREVAVLAYGIAQPGEHVVRWDASTVPSGMYLATLDVAKYLSSDPLARRVQPMIVIK